MIAPPQWSEPIKLLNLMNTLYIIKGKKQFIIEDEVVILEAGHSIREEHSRSIF
jgi:hypothetical protein